ncbi:5282_t:CDS:2 [Paraglomus occultum]|uniref:5282_t:CDS:1 n=1 Tax=Paraglomus occultum TaxID=144539 RepID=A0A9N8ZE50_9GLOM|nr:5282_t:CDS:2 [Paraglomus occultum]
MRLQGSLVIESKNDDETCTDEDVDDSESDCDDVIVTEDFDEEESVPLLDSETPTAEDYDRIVPESTNEYLLKRCFVSIPGHWLQRIVFDRRNEGRDPLLHARLGYETDVKVNFGGYMEERKSRGIPQCSLAKD